MQNINKKVVAEAALRRVSGDSGVEDLVARRSNDLILAKHRLSLQGYRLFLFVISRVKDTDDEETEYEFSINELANEIGIERAHLYKSMVDVLDELARTIVDVQVRDEDGKIAPNRFVRVGLIKNRQQIRLVDGSQRLDGRVSVSMYKELVPYVRALRDRYTVTPLKYAFRLGSSYAQRLYDLLKAWEFKGRVWTVERDELRELLGVEAGKMELWGDFRRFVLERAQQEINTHTDLAFDMEDKREGKRVTHVSFMLRRDGGLQVATLPGTPQHQAFKGMVDLGMSLQEAQRLLGEWWERDPDRITWHLKAARKGKDNPLAWFRSGMQRDYRPPTLFQVQDKVSSMRESYRMERAIGVDPALLSALDELKDGIGGGGRER